MPPRGDLALLLRTARQLVKLCEQAAVVVAEARAHETEELVMAAARAMMSDLMRTKHEAEDVLTRARPRFLTWIRCREA